MRTRTIAEPAVAASAGVSCGAPRWPRKSRIESRAASKSGQAAPTSHIELERRRRPLRGLGHAGKERRVRHQRAAAQGLRNRTSTHGIRVHQKPTWPPMSTSACSVPAAHRSRGSDISRNPGPQSAERTERPRGSVHDRSRFAFQDDRPCASRGRSTRRRLRDAGQARNGRDGPNDGLDGCRAQRGVARFRRRGYFGTWEAAVMGAYTYLAGLVIWISSFSGWGCWRSSARSDKSAAKAASLNETSAEIGQEVAFRAPT